MECRRLPLVGHEGRRASFRLEVLHEAKEEGEHPPHPHCHVILTVVGLVIVVFLGVVLLHIMEKENFNYGFRLRYTTPWMPRVHCIPSFIIDGINSKNKKHRIKSTSNVF